MYPIRVNNRLPQASRVFKAAPASCHSTRNMASIFPRFVVNEFAPVFRLMDEYSNQLASGAAFNPNVRSFNPRFDVKETSAAYELHGELPGVDQENIDIEFTDAQTLSIKGRTESRRGQGTKPTAAVNGQQDHTTLAEATQADAIEAETAASDTSSYVQPTVEDEDAMSGANPDAAESTVAADTPAASTGPNNESPTPVAPQSHQNSAHYWVSERSVGTFHRSFAFPTRIEQDNVKASLKNGILSVVVPKAAAPQNRRIDIE